MGKKKDKKCAVCDGELTVTSHGPDDPIARSVYCRKCGIVYDVDWYGEDDRFCL